MTTYAIAIGKGGTGKTTCAAEIALSLARQGRRVLMFDTDQQGNVTKRLGITDDMETGGDAYDVLVGDASAHDAAVASPHVDGVSVIVGTHTLANAEQRPEIITALRDYLPTLAGEWDDVIIDTPPSLGLLTLSALAAADVVVVPVECKGEAYDQIDRVTSVIESRIAPRLRPGQRVHWFIPNAYDGRRVLDREVVELLNERFPGRVTKPIRQAAAVADSYLPGMPVSLYAPNADVSHDFIDALTPVIQTSLTSATA